MKNVKTYYGKIHNNDCSRPAIHSVCYRINKDNKVLTNNEYILIDILVHSGKYDSYVIKNNDSGKILNVTKIAVDIDKNSYPVFKDLQSRYHKEFKKCCMTADKLYNLQCNYIITEKVTKREKGKYTTVKLETITALYYGNVVSSCLWFNDRVYVNHTIAGYIPTEFKATSPDKSTTVIREYTFTPKH